MPAPKPPEFRRRALDPVAHSEPVAQVARNLGIPESCLRSWMDRVDFDAGRKEGLTSAEHTELVELRPRNRVLEMENRDPQADQRLLRARERPPNEPSAGRRARRGRVPRRGDLPGAGSATLDVLRRRIGPALASSGRGRAAHNADPRGPRGLPRHLRSTTGACRAPPRTGVGGRPQTGRTADARRGRRWTRR